MKKKKLTNEEMMICVLSPYVSSFVTNKDDEKKEKNSMEILSENIMKSIKNNIIINK